MKKLVTLGLVVTVLVTAVLIISRGINRQPSTAQPPELPTTQLAEPATPQTETQPVKPAGNLSPAKRDAVAAAVLVNTSLSAAQLLPSGQLHSVVWKQVVPANRQAAQKVYLVAGQALAKWWGYQSVSEARVRSGYYVVTQKYKVLHIGRDRASIELYDYTHFRTSLDWDYDQEHWDASVTIVDLRRQDGQWLFVGSHDPPPADRPPAEVGLTFEQTKDRLQPYLRGFSNYADLG